MSGLQSLHIQNSATMGERNGVTLPLSYGNIQEQHNALRNHILMVDYSHFGIAEVSGDSAYELLNIMVAGDVSTIRDEQAMYTIIMDEEGHIVSDLYVLCDEERFILLSEWLTGDELCQRMTQIKEANEEALEEIEEIRSLNEEWGIVHVEGPYSWELMAEMYGMDVVGLPFQEHMHINDADILLRSGKHGEYSYKILVNKSEMEATWLALQEAGEKYELCVGGLDYQKKARLENPCWEPTLYAEFTRCPIELQMQWSVRYDKAESTGIEPLTERLAQGVTQRVIGFTTTDTNGESITYGDAIFFDGKRIGTVLESGYSSACESYIGRGILTINYAYADIPFYQIEASTGRVAINTSAIPFIRNFSFFVNPSEHSYINPARPKHLIEQIAWQKKKEEEQALAQANAEQEQPSAS